MKTLLLLAVLLDLWGRQHEHGAAASAVLGALRPLGSALVALLASALTAGLHVHVLGAVGLHLPLLLSSHWN